MIDGYNSEWYNLAVYFNEFLLLKGSELFMISRIISAVYNSFKTGLWFLKIKMKQLDGYPVLQLLIYSIVLNFVLEMLSRRSIVKGLGFVTNPLMFLLNVLIILLTLSVTMLVTRKKFSLVLISSLWLGLGVANFIVLGYRTTPLAAIDFYILNSVISILHVYVNTFQVILTIVIVGVIIVAMFFLWKKLPKNQAQFKVPLITLCVTLVLVFAVTNISLKVGALSTNFGNLADAYSEYGFAYCFSTSIYDQGISEPDEYSEENIEAVLETIDSETTVEGSSEVVPIPTQEVSTDVAPEPQPNIIMVQLESFFDVNHLKNFTFSENPTPNFTELKKTCSSGYLRVPSIGAGTANTEFEILTGMNLEYFGAGEYPYKTILQTSTCESICYNLDALGYRSHAIHNNTGTFYDRNTVFQKLGFDSYSSIEYMNNVEYNPLGWAKDRVLTAEILKALNAKEAPDFIYTISVQPHGKYPDTIVDDNQKITVILDPKKERNDDANVYGYDPEESNPDEGKTVESELEENDEIGNGIIEGVPDGVLEGTDSEEIGSEETGSEEKEIEVVDLEESYKNGFEYYVNQLAETDQFVGELISALSVYDEPTVVVFYGDHLPSMSLENADLENNDKFQTEYVLWSNFEMEQVKRDLNAYQLNAYIMERLGYDSGVLTKFHQRYVSEPDYQEELEMLQYDMLYGDKNVFEGKNPYIEKTIQMGVSETRITSAIEKGEVIFIEGENFTPWSVVYIDEEPKETLFIDENNLIVPHEKFTDERFYVAQVTNGGTILSISKTWRLFY